MVISRIALVALMSVTLLPCGCTPQAISCPGAGPTIGLSAADDAPRFLVVHGLTEGNLDRFDDLGEERRQTALQVRVAGAPAGAPAVSGEVSRRETDLVFTPRYPFRPGVKYVARFDPAIVGRPEARVVTEFVIPAPVQEPVTRVVGVYPSADVLPENLLKFYIHFSGPMSRGDAYRHIQLIDEDGRPVVAPFLELGEELWNPEMTRFTLFFDPGRVKRGLVSREELGPALLGGKTYTLVVDQAWQDGEQRPLTQSMRKAFRTGPADDRQPDPARWRIAAPAAGSRRELVITFDEPLDHAMLQRVLSVRDSGGREMAGKVTIAQHETRWSFTPDAPWQAGRHSLVVQTILEDAAGNSIARPFEVNLNQGQKPSGPAEMHIRFDVAQ